MPKRDYYYVSPRGRRLFSLALTPAALAFVGSGSPQDIAAARQICFEHVEGFAGAWLRHKGLSDWAEYWERIATEMRHGVGDTCLLTPAHLMNQASKEEVTCAAD